jgi:hypothetical protein
MLDGAKCLHAARISLVMLIMFWLMTYLGITDEQWVIVAYLVLFEYITVGCIVKSTYYRLGIIIITMLYSLAVIYFFDNNYMINLLATLGGLMICLYFFMGTQLAYIGILGATIITLMLINQNNEIQTFIKPLNMIVVLVITLITIPFFFPEYARDKVMKTQAAFLENLCHMIQNFLDHVPPGNDDSNMLKNMTTFNMHIQDAKIETRKAPSFIEKNMICFEQTKKIYPLLSVALCYLNKEEKNDDAYYRAKLLYILNRLSHIKSCMNDPRMDPFNTSEIPSNNLQSSSLFIDTLLVDIVQHIDLLSDTLQSINLIRLNQYCTTKNNQCKT